MTKGRQIAVDGQLRQDRWESQDGTKRSRVEIVADNINFMSAPRDGGGGGFETRAPREENEGSAPSGTSNGPPQGGGPASFEDDIPF
jgi:single-strand DNA-binding protein